MSEETFHKMPCTHCGDNIEFPAAGLGEAIDCPHCGNPVTLAVPVRPAMAKPVGSVPRPPAPPPRPPMAPRPPEPETQVKMKKPAELEWDEPVAATKKSSNLPQVFFLLLLLGALGGGLWYYREWKNKPKPAKVAAAAAQAKVETPKPPSPPKEEPEIPHEGPDLEMLRYQIERMKVGKLVYVTGTVTNHVKKQYFSVKAEFELFDKDGKSLGTTSDQLANLPPRGTWDIKAIVLDNKATRAELVKVSGEKE